MDGGEVATATCVEQPFDVAFHPRESVFVAGLITGEVRTIRRKPSSRRDRLDGVGARSAAARASDVPPPSPPS